MPPASTLIIIGVSGCGKTSVGEKLARRLGGVFEDADDFHTEAAKAKMRSGTPLTDEDRWPWYAKLRARIVEMRTLTPHYLLACSALKEIYRDRLRADDDPTQIAFVFLDGGFELIRDRMARRVGHYMPVSLLESQFAILEPPTDAIRVSIDQDVDGIVSETLAHFSAP